MRYVVSRTTGDAMRSGLVLVMLALMSASALAQQEGKFEAAMGIGTDIVSPAGVFKNHRNLSASICYDLTNEWGVFLYLGQQDYRLDHLTSENEYFVGYGTPTLKKTVTSFLVGARNYISGKSGVISPYGSVALGFAQSSSSPEGYSFVALVQDTVYQRVRSGHFLLGLISLGIQVRPVSFLDLFAELQVSPTFDAGLSPGPLGGRVGIGVIF